MLNLQVQRGSQIAPLYTWFRPIKYPKQAHYPWTKSPSPPYCPGAHTCNECGLLGKHCVGIWSLSCNRTAGRTMRGQDPLTHKFLPLCLSSILSCSSRNNLLPTTVPNITYIVTSIVSSTVSHCLPRYAWPWSIAHSQQYIVYLHSVASVSQCCR